MSIEISQYNNPILFRWLTNFIKKQLKIFEEISKENTIVIVGRPVTTPQGTSRCDAEFNPKEFYGGKFQI